MGPFFIGYMIFCYVLLGLITLMMYRSEFEDDWPFTKLNPDNARNIRVYFRIVILLLWPAFWVSIILIGILSEVPRFFKIVFTGLYKFIFE